LQADLAFTASLIHAEGGMYRVVLLALFLVQADARPLPSLQLRIEAPPELDAVRKRLESIDPQRFADIAQLVGWTDAGPAIHVELVPESSDLARSVSPWIAGFTVEESVVLFPARSPTYPNNSLEDVLRHEVAHALIWRTSMGRPIPRWFNEGLAMAAERQRGFEDQTQLFYQLVTGSRTSLDALDRLFEGRESDQVRAYALAGALVHNVFERHGPAGCARILSRVRRGASFEAAFTEVAGVTPAVAESEFWQRQRIWTNWLPIITSATTLWMAVTLLAILAIYRRRRRNIEIAKQWDEDKPSDDDV
jgi:hypothetical protein